jgi:hypothetical protein
MQDVERLKRDRLAVSTATGEAPTEAPEVRTPVLAQANQLAVERHAPAAEHLGDRRRLGEVVRALAAGARAQRDRAAVVAQLRAAPVPLDLKSPCCAVRHGARGEQHRRHEHRLLLAVVSRLRSHEIGDGLVSAAEQGLTIER